jgi:opacity protein-like surface antigen
MPLLLALAAMAAALFGVALALDAVDPPPNGELKVWEQFLQSHPELA